MSAEVGAVGILAKILQPLLAGLGGAGVTGVWFWSWKKGVDKANEEQDQKIHEHDKMLELFQTKFLTHDDVEHIVDKSIQPVQSNVDKVQRTCETTNELLQEFVTKFKIKEAIEQDRLDREHKGD